MIRARTLAAVVAAFVIAFNAFLSQSAQAQTSAAPYQSAVRYDPLGRVVGTISAPVTGTSGPFLATRTTYDSSGRPSVVEDGSLSSWQSDAIAPLSWGAAFTLSRKVETTYDILNRKLVETAKGSNGVAVSVTQYSYDTADRLECTAVRMNLTATLPSSACMQTGTPQSCDDTTAINSAPDDRITRNVYDAAGQLTKVQKAYATCIQEDYATYTYSANGKQTSMTDARSYRAEFKYDGFDRQIAWLFPSKTTTGVAAACNVGTVTEVSGVTGPNGSYVATDDCEKYFYDRNGNRRKLAKRDGSVLEYQYDALNRMTVKIVPSLAGVPAADTRDVRSSYDLRGLLTKIEFVETPYADVTNVYDGLGRLTSTTHTAGGVSFALAYLYDANGNRTRVTYPDTNYATYEYDGLDRPKAIKRNGSVGVASYDYDVAGRRVTFNAGGLSTSYGYEPSGRLQTLTNNLTSATSYNNQWTFAYNPASQIAAQTRSNDTFAWGGAVNVDRTYATNGLNQYESAGAASFCYDKNGSLTADGTSVYLYDVENRLIGKYAQGAGNTNCAALSYAGALQAKLRYDPLGRLQGVATWTTAMTRNLYDGDALVGEYNAWNALQRRYVHSADLKADDPIAWYQGAGFTGAEERLLRSDWQGSIVLATDSSGSTVHALNRYDEYGIPQSTNLGRFQYTGQAWIPELGMYYYKARVYSPTLGRFMQTDPIGYQSQMNLYAYVGLDPINRSDPTGMRDVYIGGVGDSVTEIVKSYAERQMKLHPERDIQYYAWDDVEAISEAINSFRFDRDEPLNVIGHSAGAAEAIRQSATGVPIDTLVTIDPVDLPGNTISDSAKYSMNYNNWINVTANPSEYNQSDYIAAYGGKVSRDITMRADKAITSGAHHGQFNKMMNEANAASVIDETY